MRRALGDAAITVTALILLILMLASVDDRVRDRVSILLGSSPGAASGLIGAGKDVSSFVSVFFEAVKDQSLAHAPMTIFALAATVLVLFMVRT